MMMLMVVVVVKAWLKTHLFIRLTCLVRRLNLRAARPVRHAPSTSEIMTCDKICITLPEKKGHIAAKNFIIRLLYKETY